MITTRVNTQFNLRPHHENHACQQQCPGGEPCCCFENSHVYHICIDPACMCHSRRRYEGRESPLGPAGPQRSRTQRVALTRLGTLDLHALMAQIRATGRRQS